jgi:hypothetical protein
VKPITLFALKASLLAIAVVAGNELAWRVVGMKPTFRDTPALWSKIRRECDGSPVKVALLGSSRFQCGLNPQVLARVLPHHQFYQLAEAGSSPLPVLEDLAHDAAFNGTAIVEILMPWPWIRYQAWPADPVTEFLNYAHHEQFGGRVENYLQMLGEERLVLFNPAAKFWFAAGDWFRTGSFHLPNQSMDSNRAVRTDFQNVDGARSLDDWIAIYRTWKQQTDPNETMETFARISAWAEQIKSRGGQVIFFRMIADGRLRAFEDETWPADRYLRPFARSQKSPVLSFQDYPALVTFHCPDGSHLDARDVDRFSEAFATILQRQGLLR